MECEDKIGPAIPLKCSVGAGLSFDLPTDPEQGCEDAPSLGGGPAGHATLKRTLSRAVRRAA